MEACSSNNLVCYLVGPAAHFHSEQGRLDHTCAVGQPVQWCLHVWHHHEPPFVSHIEVTHSSGSLVVGFTSGIQILRGNLLHVQKGHSAQQGCNSCRVVWVLKELEPENWIHNGGTDFAVQLKPPSVSDVLGKVLTAEGTYTHWSLFNRFILANEILDAADSAGMLSLSHYLCIYVHFSRDIL